MKIYLKKKSLEGGECLKRPCQYLVKKMQSISVSKPVGVTSVETSGKTGIEHETCGCVCCNADLLKLQV